MKLSERLEMVLSFVETGESAADVGTDHGHVPVELVRRGIVKKAVAMDVRKGPLSRAAENIALAGLSEKIATRLSDGVAKLLSGGTEGTCGIPCPSGCCPRSRRSLRSADGFWKTGLRSAGKICS